MVSVEILPSPVVYTGELEENDGSEELDDLEQEIFVDVEDYEQVERRRENPSPENTASCFSKFTFSWATQLFILTRRKNKQGEELEQDDLFDVAEVDQTKILTEKFESRWNIFIARLENNPSARKLAASELKWSLWNVIRWRMIFAGILKFFNSATQFCYPIILNGLLKYIQTVGSASSYEGYLWIGFLGLTLVIKGILENYYFFLVQRCGYEVRSVVSTAVFKKALRLSSSSRQNYSQGQITNLMQLDSQKLENFCSQVHILWDGLFQIAGYTIIIYFLLGNSVFVGLGVMLAAIPIQTLITGIIFVYVKRAAKETDKRVKGSNELLQSMLGVKMAAWEDNFRALIGASRNRELSILKKSFLTRALMMAFFIAIPSIVAVAGIAHYALANGTIEAAILFAALQGFGSLRFPLMAYPQALQAYADAKVSQQRLGKFMALDENKRLKAEKLDDDYDGDVLRIEDGDFFWSDPDQVVEAENVKGDDKQNTAIVVPNEDAAVLELQRNVPILEDISISVGRGELVAIIGSVGSGKSSLLSAILGELHQSKGKKNVSGTISFSNQSAWILNMTLRDNIVFGREFDETRYWKVIQVCQLEHDLETLQDGDQTIIGERGINLSGGQAQRVSVARAAYSDSDIIILDDPLSALDPEVASRLFQECVVNFMSGRTRIMVTNQLNFLPKCDHIIALSGGQDRITADVGDTANEGNVLDMIQARTPGTISEQGSYSQLLRSGLNFAAMMKKFNGVDNSSAEDEESNAGVAGTDVVRGTDDNTNVLNSAKPLEDMKSRRLMQVEERAKGSVQLSEYVSYINAGGGWCAFFFVLLVIVSRQALNIGGSVVVSVWSDDSTYENLPLETYLMLYGGSALVLALAAFLESAVILLFGLRASRKLHQSLLDGILNAPMSFFDTTPTGRIVSRFNKDVFSVDNELPRTFQFFMFTVIFMIFTLSTVVYTVYFFAAGIPILAIIYVYIVNWYRPTARDCKRLEAISRSPVYAHFGEAVNGLGSIRAYGKEDDFINANSEKLDLNIKGVYCIKVVERWLSLRLELLAAMIAVFAGCLIVYAATEGNLTPGFAGLGITFILSLTGLLGFTVRSFVNLEAGMNSVERLNYYARKIDQEAPTQSDNPPTPGWPSEGVIEIKDLTMRYRPNTPLVLRGVTVTIPAGSSVGVVGRTGCGKSSLLMTLLRIVEPESGYVKIDGVDTSMIGLHELRKKISIVPQNPVIFSGTIRSNLDTFNQYTESDLWAALERSNLKRTIEELELGLDEPVAEYGENFSQGQRQLLCMARSLLQQARILLLDEATSSVDYETDAAIQNTIRESFSTCTILTIAHRIQTVIDNDNILVMDEGTAAEFGTPRDLLDDKDSKFSSIVAEMGPEAEANLRSLVRQS